VTKSDLNQALDKPKYIVINVGWRDNLLFEIEQGMEWLVLQASAIRIEGELDNSSRKEGLKISPNTKSVTISYMSETAFKQLRLESIIDPASGPPE
jgi:hypothetical protein